MRSFKMNKDEKKLLELSEMSYLQEKVYNALPVGKKGCPVLSRNELMEITNLRDADARRVVKSLLQFGIPVISGPKGGYYIANNNKDIKEYIEFLQIHIDGTEQVKDTMKKIMKNNLFKNVNK